MKTNAVYPHNTSLFWGEWAADIAYHANCSVIKITKPNGKVVIKPPFHFSSIPKRTLNIKKLKHDRQIASGEIKK